MVGSELTDKGSAIRDLKEALQNGDFDKAMKIQNERNLGISEMNSVAVTVFAELFDRKKFSLAIELGTRFNLANEKIHDAILQEFSRFFGKGAYEEAARWAIENHLSANEVLKAASKLFKKYLKELDIKGALGVREKYQIPDDLIQDAAGKGFDAAYQRQDFLNAALLGKEFKVSSKHLMLYGDASHAETHCR